MAENLKECDPLRLVTTEIKDEHDVTVTIPGGVFSLILPNVNNIAHLHDRLYFKWNWNNWINIKIKLGPIRKRHMPIWWILRRSQTNLVFHPYYMAPRYLRTENVIFSYTYHREHCENLQWHQRTSKGLWNLRLTFRQQTKTQCWTYNYDEQICEDRPKTYCHPNLGRIERILQTSDTSNWLEQAGYEPLCRAYQGGYTPRSSMQQRYQELVNQNPTSRLMKAKWFSLNSDYFLHYDKGSLNTYTNISRLEVRMNMSLSYFDIQYNYIMNMVRDYESYHMKKQVFDSLVKEIDQQKARYINFSRQLLLHRKLVLFSEKRQQVYENQQRLRPTIQRHARLLRKDLEDYYILRVVQQSLHYISEIAKFQSDIIYQHQLFNGKIVSTPRYRIIDPPSTMELSPHMPRTTANKLCMYTTSVETTTSPMTITDASTTTMEYTTLEDMMRTTALSNPVLVSIIGALIAVGLTIIICIYRLYMRSNNTVYSDVTSVII